MATRFAAIPAIPLSGLTSWQYTTLNAMKENIDLLTGARGSSRALVFGDITTNQPSAQSMTRVSAQGVGFTISGVNVPSIADYSKLLNDVQLLANDVANLRATVAALITQLKG